MGRVKLKEEETNFGFKPTSEYGSVGQERFQVELFYDFSKILTSRFDSSVHVHIEDDEKAGWLGWVLSWLF